MSASPLVSIVIPCFRQAHFLSAALESVFAQTYPALEVVVVNDGSPDNTADVVARYGNMVKYVSQENQGVGSARNTGVAHAKGDYLLFLDADDLLHPEALAQLVAAANVVPPDTVPLMGYSLFSRDDLSDLAAQPLPVIQASSPLLDLLVSNVCVVHSFLVPRRLLRDVLGPFRAELMTCEDWDLWLRLAMRNVKFHVIPFRGAYYRRYPGSMSTNVPRMLIGRIALFQHAANQLLQSQEGDETLWGILHATAIRLIQRAISQSSTVELSALMTIAGKVEARSRTPRSSLRKRLLVGLAGRYAAERIAVGYIRLFDRRRYARLQSGYA